MAAGAEVVPGMTPDEREALVERVVGVGLYGFGIRIEERQMMAESIVDALAPEIEAGLRAQRPLPEWFPTTAALAAIKEYWRSPTGVSQAPPGMVELARFNIAELTRALRWLLAERNGAAS